MNSKTEAQILGEAYESVRNLTKFYLSKLDGVDLHQQLEINGKKFNSPYWIVAHLVWTEHSLIIRGLGNQSLDIPWLEDFSIGSDSEKIKNKPAYEEVLKKLDEVHLVAMNIINSLSDEQLDGENHIDVTFGGVNSKRSVLRHAIRHEPMHIGQISWILKVNGIKMA